MAETAQTTRPGHQTVDRLTLLFGAWVLTRLLLVVLTRAHDWYPFQDDPFDLATFPGWGHAFATGQGPVPLRDAPWEYPFGAAAVVALPALVPGAPYVLGFVALMLAGDVAVLLALARFGARHGRLTGAWLWCAAVPLLGPVALARYDVLPALTATAALVVSATSPLLAGALLGLGGTLKVWPLLLLPLLAVLPRGRRAVMGAVASTGLLAAAAVRLGYGPHLLSFLTYQRDRGIEIESVAAVPLLLARLGGSTQVQASFGFGSYQVDGPYAGLLGTVTSLGLLAVLLGTGFLLWRAHRRRSLDLDAVTSMAAFGVAGLLVFDKVLSAQYPLWLVGLVAVGASTRRAPLRTTIPLVCLLLVLTQLVYPLLIDDLVAMQPRGVLVLTARALCLVALTVQLGILASRTCSRLPPTPSEDEVPVHEQQPEHP